MELQNQPPKKKIRSQESNIKDREYQKKKIGMLQNEAKELKKLRDDYNKLESKYNKVKNFKEQKKQLLLEIEMFKESCKQLNEEKSLLLKETEQLKKTILELEEEMVQIKLENQISQKIVNNTSVLISQLSYNSPFRRPLLSYFIDGLSFEKAEQIYSISKRTFDRSISDDRENIINQKYAIEANRKERISNERKEEIKNILDDILPVQSGRNYRYQEITNKTLYEKYVSLVKSGNPVSKTYFIYTILSQYNIHHSKKMKFCVYCEKIQNGETNSKLDNHLELVSIQRRMYMRDKLAISSGDSSTVLVTQDFTQIDLESGFIQDLIICMYSYDKSSVDGLKREYKHFVGKPGEKNTISFVIGAWKELLESGWFNGIKVVKIWSDGGPKHFKISANMKFLQSVQQKYSDKIWIYNFFAPYHGCSICDGVAAQAKGILNRRSRDENIPIRKSEMVIETVQKLENHNTSSVNVIEEDFSTPTLTGIKSYFKFTFDIQKKQILAFLNSEKEQISKIYDINIFEKLL